MRCRSPPPAEASDVAGAGSGEYPAMRSAQKARSSAYSSPDRYAASASVSSLSEANRPSGAGSSATAAE
ncbi:hypothetical protein SMICM17S_12201 [Streptomyces microflavus]